MEVARRGDLASHHFQFVTYTIPIGIVDASPVALVQRCSIGALEALCRRVGGLRVVVARSGVLTTRNFQFIAHPVSVRVVHTVSVAIVGSLRVHTCPVVEVHFGVKVARTGVVASEVQARHKIARGVVDGGLRVVVAGQINHATVHLFTVANAVEVDIFCTLAATHPQSVDQGALAIALSFRNASTTANATFVNQRALAIALSFRNARSSAHPALVHFCTRSVVLGDRRVVVAGRRVHASKNFF